MNDQNAGNPNDIKDTGKRSFGHGMAVLMSFVLIFFVLIYGPLIAALLERKFFKTENVAQIFNDIGVLDVLEFIYANTPGLGP